MEAYELAFRMQTEVPGVLDLEKEDRKTLEMYGIRAGGGGGILGAPPHTASTFCRALSARWCAR